MKTLLTLTTICLILMALFQSKELERIKKEKTQLQNNYEAVQDSLRQEQFYIDSLKKGNKLRKFN